MNASFHALIGGIEAVTHFIRTRELIHPVRVQNATQPEAPLVEKALTDLAEVKLALLEAEATFMTSIANMEHSPLVASISNPGVPTPVPAGQRIVTGLDTANDTTRAILLKEARAEWRHSFNAHCSTWVAALNDESAKLASAIYCLQLLAPEWGVLDRRLAQLMQDFKQAAEFTSGGGGEPSVSLGTIFNPSSSSGSSSGS